MPIQPPLLDSRTYTDIVEQTEDLASFYTKPATGAVGWEASEEGPLDLGGTLIRVFGRMMSGVIERLNQALDKHHLAFLNLLGGERNPPVPARAPITFTPTAGA